MTFRAVAFGDLRAGIWGAALSPHPDLPSFAVLGPEPDRAIPVEVAAGASGADEWQIAGEGLELRVAVEAGNPDSPGSDFDQLVTVRGRLRRGHAGEVDCVGARSERADAVEPGRFQLVRDVCAWYGPGEGFAMVAVRLRRASGHGDERVSATIFSAGHALLVAEPRLSTAYAEAGQPVRATLEMWLADDDSGESDQEETVQYPRRAAGEAYGPGAAHQVDQLELGVHPFRWRAEGRDGPGIYLLARAR